MKFIKKCINIILKIFGIKISKINIGNYTKNYEIWRSNGEFMQLFNEIKGRTLVSIDRCFMVWHLAKCASNKEGDMAEVGVYKGGTAKILAKNCPNNKIHLFDTFSGMPETRKGIDLHKKGDFCDTSLSVVEKFLTDCNNVILHPGFFPETTKGLEAVKFCFVYIDVDIYASVRDCLNFFYGRMVKGGLMLFDDWEWRDCPGVKKAVDEFFKDKKEKPLVTAVNQCAIIKL